MNNRFLILLVHCLWFTVSGNAILLCQTSMDVQLMGTPQIYVMPEINSATEDIMSIIPGAIWMVFSDRNENNIFMQSDSREIKEQVQFLDPFYVTNERNGFLHLYRDPGPGLDLGKLSSNAQDMGWIHKSHLLLWRHCILDSITKREIQLLTYGTSGPLHLFEAEDYNDGISVFEDPELKFKSDKKTRSNLLYYAYKVTEKSILIGCEKRISAGLDPFEVILGWVPRNYCFILSSRFWLSPNDDFRAIEERVEKKIYLSLFVDYSSARQFHYNHNIEPLYVLWQDQENKSYPPTWLRFPIQQEKGAIVKVNIASEDFISAYTSETVKGLSFPVFKRVTLIGYDELSEVLYNMGRMLDAVNSSNIRKDLQQTIVRLMSDEYQGVESEFVYNLTLASVFENLFWICQSDATIINQKVRKLTDPYAISEDSLREFIAVLVEKEKMLQQIMVHDMDQYSFISNNTRFFWVDVEMFF